MLMNPTVTSESYRYLTAWKIVSIQMYEHGLETIFRYPYLKIFVLLMLPHTHHCNPWADFFNIKSTEHLIFRNTKTYQHISLKTALKKVTFLIFSRLIKQSNPREASSYLESKVERDKTRHADNELRDSALESEGLCASEVLRSAP